MSKFKILNYEEKPMTELEYAQLIPEMSRVRLNNLREDVQQEIGWLQNMKAGDREVTIVWQNFKNYISYKNLIRLINKSIQ